MTDNVIYIAAKPERVAYVEDGEPVLRISIWKTVAVAFLIEMAAGLAFFKWVF